MVRREEYHYEASLRGQAGLCKALCRSNLDKIGLFFVGDRLLSRRAGQAVPRNDGGEGDCFVE